MNVARVSDLVAHGKWIAMSSCHDSCSILQARKCIVVASTLKKRFHRFWRKKSNHYWAEQKRTTNKRWMSRVISRVPLHCNKSACPYVKRRLFLQRRQDSFWLFSILFLPRLDFIPALDSMLISFSILHVPKMYMWSPTKYDWSILTVALIR